MIWAWYYSNWGWPIFGRFWIVKKAVTCEIVKKEVFNLIFISWCCQCLLAWHQRGWLSLVCRSQFICQVWRVWNLWLIDSLWEQILDVSKNIAGKKIFFNFPYKTQCSELSNCTYVHSQPQKATEWDCRFKACGLLLYIHFTCLQVEHKSEEIKNYI